MFRTGRILVATDFSAQSDEALRRALALGRALSGHTPAAITLLHVIEPAVMYDGDLLTGPALMDLDEVRRKSARESIEHQIETQVGHGRRAGRVTVTPEIVEDGRAPATVICERAERIEAELIVVGRHGHGMIDRLLIGSTAERVVRHAPCAVLVTVPRAKAEGA
ncbi:MAG: universal stress protein [Mariprofundaceae bacterium]